MNNLDIKFQDGEEAPASWELRVEGRLLDEVSVVYFEKKIIYRELLLNFTDCPFKNLLSPLPDCKIGNIQTYMI